MVVMTMILEIMMTMMLKMKTMMTMTIEKTGVSSVTVVNQPPSHASISADTAENHSPFIWKNGFLPSFWPKTLDVSAKSQTWFQLLPSYSMQCCIWHKSLKAWWTDIVVEKSQTCVHFSSDTAENNSPFIKVDFPLIQYGLFPKSLNVSAKSQIWTPF